MIGLGLIYQLQQLKPSTVELEDPFWEDKIYYLPDGSKIMVRDLKKALDGLDFFYFKKGERKLSKMEGILVEVWTYYFSVFHNCEEFGLPHGKGWVDELPWLIPFLTQMRYIKRLISLDTSNRVTSGDVSPQTFTGG